MAIWKAEFIAFGKGAPQATASLTVEDLGSGSATGTLRNFRGPVSMTELDLGGVVQGATFILAGSGQQLGIHLSLHFSPFVSAFAGSARIVLHESQRVLELFVITSPSE